MKIRLALVAAFVPLWCLAQNEAGTIKVTTTLHDDGSKTVTKLDPDAHTSTAERMDGHDKLLQRVVYELNDENQPVSGTVFAANGAVLFRSVYKHDGMDRISEENDYTPDGKLMRRFVYEFGSGGKVSRIRAFDGAGNELQQSAARTDEKKVPPRRHR